MACSLKVTGGNPYTVEFVPDPTDPREMAKVWELAKNDPNTDACLELSMSPVAGSERKTKRQIGNDPVKDADIPQKMQVTLSCGKCTCGGTFRARIFCYYDFEANILHVDPKLHRPVILPPVPLEQFFSITCAGPGCTNDLWFVSVPLIKPELKKSAATRRRRSKKG
jgi:hypothetical protein